MKQIFFITILFLLGSFLTSAQEVVNMYPNFEPGAERVIQYIAKSNYGISRKEISPVMPLEVNGQIRKGAVKTSEDTDLYEIKVYKEGLLSIVADPIQYDSKKGILGLKVYANDNRMDGGTVIRQVSTHSSASYQRDDGWAVTDSKSFYAYPGTYYLQVNGKYGDKAGAYIPLSYQVRVIQDGKVDSYSGNLGKDMGPYNPISSSGYPYDLGITILNNSINVISSLGLEHWVRRSKDKSLASKSARRHDNARDVFSFTPSTSGKVYFHLSAFSLDAMDVWQRAWKQSYKKYNTVLPVFSIQLWQPNQGNHISLKNQSSISGSIDVVAGKECYVQLKEMNAMLARPAYYRLHISYSDKLPPMETGDDGQSDEEYGSNNDHGSDDDSRSGNINQRSEPFDPSPNESRNNELNGIWGNNYIAYQIDGNKASLFQTTDINYWQNYNIDKGGLILKNIQKNGHNMWQCDVMWLFPNTPYMLWMAGIIEMNSDGNSITITKTNPCDGSLAYQTLYRKMMVR